MFIVQPFKQNSPHEYILLRVCCLFEAIKKNLCILFYN